MTSCGLRRDSRERFIAPCDIGRSKTSYPTHSQLVSRRGTTPEVRWG